MEKESAWSFSAWRDGIMARYWMNILLTFLAAVYLQSILSFNQSQFGQLYNLRSVTVQGVLDASLLDSRITYQCSPSPKYELSQEQQDQNALKFYENKIGTVQFQELIQNSSRIICKVVFQNFYTSNFIGNFLMTFMTIVFYLPVTYCFFAKTKRLPWKKYICYDQTLLELSALALMIWFVIGPLPEITADLEYFPLTVVRIKQYFQFLRFSEILQPYFTGVLMILMSLRFFVSMKATHLFGPFIKLIKISAVSLFTWLTVTILILSGASYFLNSLLAPYDGCSSYYSCLKIMIEASVGLPRFNEMRDRREAQLSLGAFAILLNLVVMGIVIAKINFNYQDILRRGKLFYYKDLFEARYRYKAHNQFGFLASLQFPFGSALLPCLCRVRCLSAKRKQYFKRKAKSALFQTSSYQNQNSIRLKSWRCCWCCCKCDKKSNLKGQQIEDFNHCMLRIIYFFHLILFTLIVFIGGFLLLPFGYIAILVLHIKQLFHHQYSKSQAGPRITLRSKPNRNSVKIALFCKILKFAVVGPVYLFIKNFSDTRAFMVNCWSTENDSQSQREIISSNIARKPVPVTCEQLTQVYQVMERIHIESKYQTEIKQIRTPPLYEIKKFYKSLHFSLKTNGMIDYGELIFQVFERSQEKDMFMKTFKRNFSNGRDFTRVVPQKFSSSLIQMDKISASEQSDKCHCSLEVLHCVLQKLQYQRRKTRAPMVQIELICSYLKGFLMMMKVRRRIELIRKAEVPLLQPLRKKISLVTHFDIRIAEDEMHAKIGKEAKGSKKNKSQNANIEGGLQCQEDKLNAQEDYYSSLLNCFMRQRGKEDERLDCHKICIIKTELLEEAARRLRIKEEKQGAIDEVRRCLQQHILFEAARVESRTRKKWIVPM